MPKSGLSGLDNLDGSNGIKILGFSAKGFSGSSVTNIGDFNADGVDDFLVSAPASYNDQNAFSAVNTKGSAFVIFGSQTWDQSSIELASLNGKNGFKIDGKSDYDWLGYSASAAGDLNGDNIDDLVLSATGAGSTSINTGEVYVLFGGKGWTESVFDLNNLSGSNGYTVNGVFPYDEIGNSISSAGDINGDGLDDFIIGAYSASGVPLHGTPTYYGKTYIIFGSEQQSKKILNVTELNGVNGFQISGNVDYAGVGYSVSGAGDVNGDGLDDIVILVNNAEGEPMERSAVAYVLYGSDQYAGSAFDLQEFDANTGFMIKPAPGDKISSVSAAGDINNDGLDDVIIAASDAKWSDGSGVGKVHIVYGKKQRSEDEVLLRTLSNDDGFLIKGLPSWHQFGESISSAGDVNGDGVDDIIIGAPGSSVNDGSEVGSVYILYGSSDLPVEDVDHFAVDQNGYSRVIYSVSEFDVSSLDELSGTIINGNKYGRFGYSVSSAGDINGDGFDDILVGAPRVQRSGMNDVGESYLIYGGAINRDPIITSIPTLVAYDQEEYRYRLVAEDEDLKDVLTFRAVSLPKWLTFDPEVGELYGTPFAYGGVDATGAYYLVSTTVELTVRDTAGNVAYQSFPIRVLDSKTKHDFSEPLLQSASIEVTSVGATNAAVVSLSAFDPSGIRNVMVSYIDPFGKIFTRATKSKFEDEFNVELFDELTPPEGEYIAYSIYLVDNSYNANSLLHFRDGSLYINGVQQNAASTFDMSALDFVIGSSDDSSAPFLLVGDGGDAGWSGLIDPSGTFTTDDEHIGAADLAAVFSMPDVLLSEGYTDDPTATITIELKSLDDNSPFQTRSYDIFPEQTVRADAPKLTDGSPLYFYSLTLADSGLTLSDLIDGDYLETVRATDPSGNSSSSSSKIIIDTVAPVAPVIDLFMGDDILTEDEVGTWVMSGQAEANSELILSVEGSPNDRTDIAVDATGFWSISADDLQLTRVEDFPPDGVYTIEAVSVDLAGNVSSITEKTIQLNLEAEYGTTVWSDVRSYANFVDSRLSVNLINSPDWQKNTSAEPIMLTGDEFFSSAVFDAEHKVLTVKDTDLIAVCPTMIYTQDEILSAEFSGIGFTTKNFLNARAVENLDYQFRFLQSGNSTDLTDIPVFEIKVDSVAVPSVIIDSTISEVSDNTFLDYVAEGKQYMATYNVAEVHELLSIAQSEVLLTFSYGSESVIYKFNRVDDQYYELLVDSNVSDGHCSPSSTEFNYQWESFYTNTFKLHDDGITDVVFLGSDDHDSVDLGINGGVIFGRDGDDYLFGGEATDHLFGGLGDDTLNGGAGNDTLDGGEGDDEIYGGDGDDIIYTSAGNDIYDGGDGIDTVITDYINSPPTVGGSISLRNIENQFFIGETNITIDRSLDPESGNNHVKSQSGDDRVLLGVGDDTFELGSGKNYSGGGAGKDTIILEGGGTFGSGFVAFNISSALQTGTEERINLNGKTRFEDVIDGGADVDTVELTDASDAFFLHDSFSGFHSSLTLSNDHEGRSGTARIENIENINAGDGDDIIDLTSPDYSLSGQNITVDGGEGNDTLWGSDADETLKGGNGDDVLFGGAGTNTLTGGAGADEFQFTRTSIADTVTDYDLNSGDQLTFFYEAGGEEAEWSFSISNGDLRWGANTIDFGTMEIAALGELSIFVEEIGSGQATQYKYVPELGEEVLRLDLYPALYEQDYYSKIVTDLQFAEFDNLANAIDADMTFLGGLNEVAVATGLEANGNGFSYSAGAVYNNTYNTVEISADITNFKIDGIAANPISLQALLEATTIAPGKVGGLFNSITLSANSVDYLTLKHSANGLSLVYDNATNGMINELRLDGSFENDLNKVIPVVSDLLSFDFSDPIGLLGSQEFLDTSADLENLATLSGLSILQKGVAEPYLQLTATDTTLNVAYKDWDIVGAIEVSETWQPDPDAFLTALQNLVIDSNDLDLTELGSLYQGAGSLSLSILHDDAGKLAEGIIYDFGDLLGSMDLEAGDEFIFGTDVGDSYAIDSNGLAAVVFKDRDFNETQITELLDELDIRVGSEGGSSSATVVSSALGYEIEDALTISLVDAGLQLDDFTSDALIIA